jgi:hypothetical protein
MPTPTAVLPINGSQLFIAIGNGGSPETFAHPCMINAERGIEFTSNPLETMLPHCSPDEDLAAWVERQGDGLSAQITGAGMMDTRNPDQAGGLESWSDWFILQEIKNIHVIVGDVGYWRGAFLLTTLRIAGPGRKQKVTFDCTLQNSGAVSWVRTT